MSAGKERGLDEAKKVLDEFNVKRAPVPIERIIKAKGIVLEYAPLEEELSGMAYIQDDISIIGLNALHHPNRQRFSAAHELAHHILHNEEIRKSVHVDKGLRILRRDTVSSEGTDPMEIEANAFAAELLMPRNFLMEAINLEGMDIEDDASVEKLARKFRVSASAMRYRLAALT